MRKKGLAFLPMVGLGIVFVALSGCGEAGSCTVTGKVTFKGKPVCTGMVNLVGPKGLTASGGIDIDGSYTVPNAPTGLVKVGVVSDKPADVRSRAWKRESGEPPPPPPVQLPWFPIDVKYADPEKSGKEMKLGSGTNKVDIVLE